MCTLLGYFGMPGPLEMMIVAAIILLLFGNRLPSVMRSLGKGITEFKKGVQGIEDEVDKATQQVEQASKPKQEEPASK